MLLCNDVMFSFHFHDLEFKIICPFRLIQLILKLGSLFQKLGRTIKNKDKVSGRQVDSTPSWSLQMLGGLGGGGYLDNISFNFSQQL